MFDLRTLSQGSFVQKLIPAGIYQSVVTKVQWREDYVKDTVFEVFYDLTSKDGKCYTHSELFENTKKNKRTREFIEYLEDHEIFYAEDFVGCREELDIRKAMKRGKTYSSICDRVFLGRQEDTTS